MSALQASRIFDLKGQVAVVTGGGTGIGLMVAQTLAANGAKVYITGRRKHVLDASVKAHGGRDKLGSDTGSLHAVSMDISTKEGIQEAIKTICSNEKFVNILVNNAGIGGGRAAAPSSAGAEKYGSAMFEEEMNDWDQVYHVNNTSIYFTSAAFLPLLKAAEHNGPSHVPGSIINISSQSGITKWSQNSQYSYNCSKAATNHLTRMLAYELSNENIGVRVNALCPGYFPTELTTGTSDAENKTTWEDEPFQKEMLRVGANVPAGRPGKDSEMASCILLLATNNYIMGQCLVVDGGLLLRHPSTG